MKRQLILIRHTKSSWTNMSLKDFDRPLDKDRVEDAIKIAKVLKDLDLKPDLIICSPALRTRQTAEHFCSKLKYDIAEVTYDKRIYEATEDEILEVVREVDEAVKTLVVIGHNPGLTDFVNLFLIEKIFHIPTTGIVWLEFECDNWGIYSYTPNKLKYFLTRKTI